LVRRACGADGCRKDACGIAQRLIIGWFRSVRRKSADAREVRALLVGRKLLQSKLHDVEFSIRGILRGFGLRVGEVSKGRFAAWVEELIECYAMLQDVAGARSRPLHLVQSGWSALRTDAQEMPIG
jgi:transposase